MITNWEVFGKLVQLAEDPTAPSTLVALREIFPQSRLVIEHALSMVQQGIASPIVHPNGFLRLDLQRGPSGSVVRLHLWPDSVKHEPGDIHSHFWDFSSLAITGKFVLEGFVPVKRPGATGCLELETIDSTHHRLRPIPGVAPLESTREVLTAGGIHSLRTGCYHRILPLAAIGATLVLQGPRKAVQNRIFRSGGGYSPQEKLAEASTALAIELLEQVQKLCPPLVHRVRTTPGTTMRE